MMRINPTSSTTSTIEYEVYRHKKATDAQFKEVYAVFQKLRSENESLSNQKSLSSNDKTPFYFEGRVRALIERHRNQEKAVKHEIAPAKQVIAPRDSQFTTQDDALCAGLCETDKKKLEW